MKGSPHSMKFLRPRTVREALRLYARNPNAIPLAGATDFMTGWNAGLLDGKTIIDLTALKPWAQLTYKKTGASLGALLTHAHIRDNPHIRKHYPLLSLASATVGGEQIQNRGTLGGNIANASPAGDTFAPLLVYEARVRLLSEKGSRTLPLTRIFTGVKRTSLEPSELIERIEIPALRRPTRSLFRKVGTRAAQAISKICAAGVLWQKRNGSIETIRFALGSVAPTVRRLYSVEAFLTGRALTRSSIEDACRLVEEDISPIDDIRSTRAYRLKVSRNILRAFLVDKNPSLR